MQTGAVSVPSIKVDPASPAGSRAPGRAGNPTTAPRPAWGCFFLPFTGESGIMESGRTRT